MPPSSVAMHRPAAREWQRSRPAAIAPAPAMTSNNQPMRFLGRRAAISTPRVPTIGTPRNTGSDAVSGESIAFQSRTSRTRLAIRSRREKSPIAQASRTAIRSQSAVMTATISTGLMGCRWCDRHLMRVLAPPARRTVSECRIRGGSGRASGSDDPDRNTKCLRPLLVSREHGATEHECRA
jgi:hypothetical protein